MTPELNSIATTSVGHQWGGRVRELAGGWLKCLAFSILAVKTRHRVMPTLEWLVLVLVLDQCG